jgi:hypothetical protein
MKTVLRLGQIPDGDTPLANTTVTVRRISDGATLAVLVTDSDGFATLERSGHLEPYYVHLGNVPGGDKYWRSDDVRSTGVLSWREAPVGLRVLGDGVVSGYEDDLAASVNGTTLTVLAGAAVVAGHPVVQYDPVVFTLARPASGTRIDRVILYVYPEGSATTPGLADLGIIAGEVDAGVPALTQTATVYQIGLAQVSVPAAGAITVTDERDYARAIRVAPDADGIVSGGVLTTDEVGGEALTGMSVVLSLPTAETYDIHATLSGQQGPVAGDTDWTLLGTFGSGPGSGIDPLQFNTPGQVAVDAIGEAWVADTGNNRILNLNTDGTYDSAITGLTAATGVALDSSGNVYVAWHGGPTTSYLRKYNASLASQWTATIGTVLKHVATDGTHVYVTDTSQHTVYKRLCSTGAAASPATIGSAGSGNGQFSIPWGVAVAGAAVYVVDSGNNRVQEFDTAGVYQRQFAVATGCRGINADGLWLAVASHTNNRVTRYSTTGTVVDAFDQATPDGIGWATGDVLWVSNAGSHSVAKWDEVTSAAGYGEVAVEIDGSVGTYLGIGNRDGFVQNVGTGTKTGGLDVTCTVRAFAKATSGTATFKGLVLSARAIARR